MSQAHRDYASSVVAAPDHKRQITCRSINRLENRQDGAKISLNDQRRYLTDRFSAPGSDRQERIFLNMPGAASNRPSQSSAHQHTHPAAVMYNREKARTTHLFCWFVVSSCIQSVFVICAVACAARF
jgi:hypothetical protein